MVKTLRTRTSTENTRVGYYELLATGKRTSFTLHQLYDVVIDFVDTNDNNDFDVTHYHVFGGLINGQNSSWKFVDCPALYIYSSYMYEYILPSDHPSGGVLAALALSRTNPNRSSMEALENLADLGSIPSLVQNTMDERLRRLWKHTPPNVFRRLKKVAKYHLLIQFGIIPLISDITTLLGFQKLVDQRVREIEKLRTRGLRRTIDLYDGSAIHQQNVTLQSVGVSIHSTLLKNTMVKIRGHVRWYANGNFYISDQQVRALAQKIVSGYTLDPSALYEALPWSWLVDYFSNLGTLVKANRNSFPVTHDAPRIMYEYDTHTVSSNTTMPSSVQMDEIKYHANRKWRIRTNATLNNARIDFLSGKQWSILGALSIVKSIR